MFKLKNKSISEKVEGVFSIPIQYEVRVQTGNWSSYFGHYQNQKWGMWDSNSCWALSAINCIEDQLEYLYKNNFFSQEAKDFFNKNGYIDIDGDFSLSERFLEVLSGVHDNGNNQMEAWRLSQAYGCIPRDDLTYTETKANSFMSKTAFNADYFNPLAITPLMKQKGQKFLSYVNIARQWIGANWTTPNIMILQAALKQSPLQIGIPVPSNVWNWNNSYVSYDGKVGADHAVELYGIDDNGNYLIFDQYMPNLKTLSKDYLLPMVTQGIISAVAPQVINTVPQPQGALNDGFWTMVMGWWNNIFYPNKQIGKVV